MLPNVRHLLTQRSKGESKSKVTKSVKFGGGQWQVRYLPLTS